MDMERGVLERTFVVSSRVDARDMATVTMWLQNNGQLGLGRMTKSAIVAQAIKVLTNTIIQQSPELGMATMEQAYETLGSFGLLSQSTQALAAFARGLQAEQLAKGQQLEFSSFKRVAQGVYSGQGLRGEQLQQAVSAETARIANQRSNGAKDRDKMSEKEIEIEIANSVAWYAVNSEGKTQEEADELLKQELVRINEKYESERRETVRQATEALKRNHDRETPADEVEQNKLDGASDIYMQQVLTGKWTEQEFAEKVFPKAWPDGTPKVWQEKFEIIIEMALAKKAKKPQVVDSELSPADRAERERTELAMQRAAMGGRP